MDNFFDETVFLVHAALSAVIYSAYIECKNILGRFNELKTYEVGKQLNAALSSNGQSIGYTAIRGRVQAVNEPLISSHGKAATIKLLLSVDHFRNRIFTGTWGTSENLKSSTSVFVPFGLRDPSSHASAAFAIIDEPARADLRNILVTVGTTFENIDNSMVSSFITSIVGKQKVGTETIEKILPAGSLLTAIGKVTRYTDGTIHVSYPYDPAGNLPLILTTLSIEEIKSSYRSQLRSYGFGTILLGSIAGVFAVKVICKWISKLYNTKLRREIVKKRNPNGIAGLHDSQICIACLSNPREVLFIPCGHVCTCVDCWAKLNDNRCPVCRDFILYSYPAYIP